MSLQNDGRNKHPDNDDDEPLVRRAKLVGRALGWMFVVYLVYSLGQMAKIW